MNMLISRKRTVSLFLLVAVIWFSFFHVVRADESYEVFDSVHYDKETSGFYADAKAYADTSGLVRLQVTISLFFSYAEAKAWADLYKTVQGQGRYVRPSITYLANGFEAKGSTKKIILNVRDASTGETVGQWLEDLQTNIGEYTSTLVGDWFYAYSDKQYVYTVEVYLHTSAWGLSGHHTIDFYSEPDYRVFVQELYIEYAYGGCPYVSTWNGSGYVLDNNLLPASEYTAGDVIDYYRLEQTHVPRIKSRRISLHSLLLSEFENEHDYFDQVRLLAVDHSSDVRVAVSPRGEVLTYTEPDTPNSAIDNERKNVKHLINSIDGEYYQGYNGSYIILDFGDELDVSQSTKLVIRSDLKSPIYIQTTNSAGEWQTVATIYTRNRWATDVINISDYLPDAKGNLKVRLQFICNDRIDYVGLDTSPQATVDIREGKLTLARHSVGGNVTASLRHSDDNYAELLPGQEIELGFILPKQTMETRDYIIIVEGHYYNMKP